ncbi:MAG: alpha-2-macroglobulin family protein, partial [Chitinophagaceae bacterium]
MIKHTFLSSLFCWLAFAINAQVKMNDYTESWKKVSNLMEKKFLPESALKEVQSIYAQAKKEKNDVQQIKALVYMGQLMETTQEDARLKYIQLLDQEIKIVKQPALSLLYSMRASAYWGYLQEHRWELYQRTQIQRKGSDIKTWTAIDLHAEITKNYLASLNDKKALELAKLNSFEPIIIKGNQRNLRPSLYDLTAHAALTYFTNNERDLQKYAASFEITDPEAFSAAEQFAKHKFIIADSSYLYAQALLLYQDLTRFHLSDKNPEALIDLELSRLQFFYEHSVVDNKNDLYLKSLRNIQNRYKTDPASAQAAFLKASKELEIYRADEHNMGKASSRDALPKIKKDCEQVLLQFPESEGGLNCKRLLQQLDNKELSLEMEKVNLPNQPMRCLVGFKNISTFFYRIIPLTETIEASLTDRWNNKYWRFLKDQKYTKEFKQELPLTDDLQNHTAEIKIDGLAPGRYILLASGDQNFSDSKNSLSAQYFYVSQIAYINRGNDYFVLNRESGKPLQQADVAVW